MIPAQTTRGRPGLGKAPRPWTFSSNRPNGSAADGHRQAEFVQVAILDIAQERQRDVERLALDPAATGDLGAAPVASGRAAGPTGSGIGMAMKVRVVSRIVVVRPTSPGGTASDRALRLWQS